MGRIRCPLCGKEFDLENDFSRMPEHWLGRRQRGPYCSGSYGYGYIVNKKD